MNANEKSERLDWSDLRTWRALGEVFSTPFRRLDALRDGFDRALGRRDAREIHLQRAREFFARCERENRGIPRQLQAAVATAKTVEPQRVTWREDTNGKLIVSDGRNSATISAPQLKQLFLAVADANGRSVAWWDLLRLLMEKDGRSRVSVETLQRNGRRVKKTLRELGFRWEQDGSGARFDDTPAG